MSECFLKLHKPFGGNVKIESGISDYANKADLKEATGAVI